VLAGEDRRIADECGTSTAMIHRHCLHELDRRHELPSGVSFDRAVRDAMRQPSRGMIAGPAHGRQGGPAAPIRGGREASPRQPLGGAASGYNAPRIVRCSTSAGAVR
jgi:hypothetical protein